MRVGMLAHLLNFSPGYRQAGVSRYTEYLVRELPQLAPADQFLVYAGRRTVNSSESSRRPRDVTWSLSRFPTDIPQVRILWEQAIAPVALARDRIDVVHAPVQVAPLIRTRPTVVTIHDLAFLVYPEQFPGAKQRYLNVLTRQSVRGATRVIAVSENTRQDIVRHYGVDPARITVVPNGVGREFTIERSSDELNQFRVENDLPERFMLFVGTLQPRKNLITLLRAWARMDDAARLPLVVVGAQGWLYEPIYEEVRGLGVADEVHFKGFVDADRLPLWYSAATVFVYPSLYEGFGLPVIEAMASGTPVVTSSTSSLPEVAGDAALLVDPMDEAAVRQAITEIVLRPALRDELRIRGMQRARQFTWTHTAAETLAVYRESAGAGKKLPVTKEGFRDA